VDESITFEDKREFFTKDLASITQAIVNKDLDLSSLRIDSSALNSVNQYDPITGHVKGFKVGPKTEVSSFPGDPL
jgi:hypothetical protein